jgi:hypothetical protein
MGIQKDQVFKEIRPKIPNWLDEDEKRELLEEIGDYVTTTILDLVGDGVSPVNGFGEFKSLSEEYAKKKGTDLANLELEGDMLSALTYEVEEGNWSVKVGIFEPDEAIKLYGHNTGFKGHPWLEGKAPQRKVIPDKKEQFVGEIQDGIELIIEEFIDARQNSEEASGA